jgi:nucleoside 2-deoxyribosyltransferase
MKVYLAGPDVFFPDAMAVGRRKKEICSRYGLTGFFPLDSGINEAADVTGVPPSMQIFRGCITMMEETGAIIANLTPFRGPSADAGTVLELGYMAARGKICAGYTNRRDGYAGRTECAAGVAPGGSGLANRDREGHVIENFGLADNLMIVHVLDTFGHPLMVPDAEPEDIWRDLTLFDKCAAWIAGQR